VHHEDIGATGCFGERRRHRHPAAKFRIGRLELDLFDHLLIRDELHEAAVVSIGMRG
jgi:hypothetical protein